MLSLTRRITATSAALLLILGSLAGCAPFGARFDATTAGELQASVLAVTTAAAAGNLAEADAALDALEKDLREGTASGDIDPLRGARIQAAIDLVRADLAAAAPADEVGITDQPGGPGKAPGKKDKKKGGPGKDKP